jgi:hypothetical protein
MKLCQHHAFLSDQFFVNFQTRCCSSMTRVHQLCSSGCVLQGVTSYEDCDGYCSAVARRIPWQFVGAVAISGS